MPQPMERGAPPLHLAPGRHTRGSDTRTLAGTTPICVDTTEVSGGVIAAAFTMVIES